MAKRTRASVRDWQGLENLDFREPTDSDVEAILAKVRTPLPGGTVQDLISGEIVERREALKRYLNAFLSGYAIASRGHARPSRQEEIKAFAKIGANAEALLKSLHALNEGGSWPRGDFNRMPYLFRVHLVAQLEKVVAPEPAYRSPLIPALLGFGPGHERARQLVESALSAVHMLAGVARAAEREAKARTEKTAGRPGRREDRALTELIDGLQFAWSKSWERPAAANVGGPFFRFCRAVIEMAGAHRTNNALSHVIRNVRARDGGSGGRNRVGGE